MSQPLSYLLGLTSGYDQILLAMLTGCTPDVLLKKLKDAAHLGIQVILPPAFATNPECFAYINFLGIAAQVGECPFLLELLLLAKVCMQH